MHESSISTVLGFVIIVVIGLLIVNYFRQTDTGDTLLDGTSVTEQLAENEHKVVAGETLWSISEKYYGTGFEWEAIREANELPESGEIEVGQVLTLPEVAIANAETETEVEVVATATAQPTIEPVETQKPEVEITADSYTVVHGDSLWEIAEKVYGDGYRWSDIANANKLVNPGVIHAGNVLVLPR